MLSQFKKSAKLLFIAFVLSAPLTIAAQKLEKPVIDSFLNDTTYFTTTEWIASNGFWSLTVKNANFYLSKKNGVIFGHISATVTAADYKRFHVTAGNQILFKLADKSLVTFSAYEDEKAKHEGIGLTESWTAYIPFSVVKNDIQRILASPVTAIRIQTDGMNYDYDIKPKDAAKLTKMFQLILDAK